MHKTLDTWSDELQELLQDSLIENGVVTEEELENEKARVEFTENGEVWIHWQGGAYPWKLESSVYDLVDGWEEYTVENVERQKIELVDRLIKDTQTDLD